MEQAEPTLNLPKQGDVLVGKYRVQGVLREGGMGAILQAYHEALDQRVAVKVLRADAAKEDVTVQRFVFEAQVAAKLACEHVARVIDAGRLESGLPFLAMEYLDGCDLGELLKLEGPLPIADLVDYMLQALTGIATAHAADVVHRDLKPSNLFLALRSDGTHAIKILDFGISKMTAAESNPNYKSLTGQQMLGSPVYMSPEQIRNARAVDARSDLWSLGILMYELACGTIPFDGDGVGEILAAILDAKAIPLCERNPKIPRAFSEIVGKCLQKDREARYQTAAELAHAIAPFGSGKHKALVDQIAKTLVHGQNQKNAVSVPKTRAASGGRGAMGAYGGPDVATVPPPPPPIPREASSLPRIALSKSDPPLEREELERTHPSIRRRRRAGAAAGIAFATVACVTTAIVFTSSRGASTSTLAAAQIAPAVAIRSEPVESAPAPSPDPSASQASQDRVPAPVSADDPAPSARPSAPVRPAWYSGNTRPGSKTVRPPILRSRD